MTNYCPHVSLIIPTYQREKVLCDSISYALNQDYADYEIVVVDQTDTHEIDTQRFLNQLPDFVRIVNHRPPSLTGARNRGILEAHGEIVIMIDDDVIIESDFISQHLRHYHDTMA